MLIISAEIMRTIDERETQKTKTKTTTKKNKDRKEQGKQKLY